MLNQVAGFGDPLGTSGEDAGDGEGLGLAAGVSSAAAQEIMLKSAKNQPRR